MGNIAGETADKKAPRKSFAVASLVCGILSLAGGAAILVWFTPADIFGDIPLNEDVAFNWLVIVSLADSDLLFILPLLAVIFGAVPLYQGKGTDWDGKDMAKAGVVMGIITLLAFLSYYAYLQFSNMLPAFTI
jgi:hypothetical protein